MQGTKNRFIIYKRSSCPEDCDIPASREHYTKKIAGHAGYPEFAKRKLFFTSAEKHTYSNTQITIINSFT